MTPTPTPPVAGDVRALLPCPFCACSMSIDPVARDWWRLSGDHDDRCILSSSETDVPQTPEQLDVLCADWNRRSALSAASAAEPQGWISVDERLPNDGQEVIARYWPYDNRENSQCSVGAIYDAGADEFLQDTDGDPLHRPSHWMPLPPAPGASQVHLLQGETEGGAHG